MSGTTITRTSQVSSKMLFQRLILGRFNTVDLWLWFAFISASTDVLLRAERQNGFRKVK